MHFAASGNPKPKHEHEHEFMWQAVMMMPHHVGGNEQLETVFGCYLDWND